MAKCDLLQTYKVTPAFKHQLIIILGDMPVIQATWEAETEGSWFKASSGKKLIRPYPKEQAGHSGLHLQSQLCRRQR
jgi:hypothetical protein